MEEADGVTWLFGSFLNDLLAGVCVMLAAWLLCYFLRRWR